MSLSIRVRRTKSAPDDTLTICDFTVCGGDLNVTTHGTIATPGSPGNYPMNSNCEWFITAPPGKRIQFLFYTLMIEAHDTCNFDYVEIHSGLGVETASLGKFCNSTNPPPLLTPGHTATIHFHSDGDSNDVGFQIAFSVVEGVPGCGGIYTASKGEVMSPTGIDDGKYKHNMICEYVLQMPTGSRVRVNFKKFALEDSAGCKFDRVEVSVVRPTLSVQCPNRLINNKTFKTDFRRQHLRG